MRHKIVKTMIAGLMPGSYCKSCMNWSSDPKGLYGEQCEAKRCNGCGELKMDNRNWFQKLFGSFRCDDCIGRDFM